MQDKYYRFSDYLKKRFGSKVYKVSVDAGFGCPNRDGTISSGGCIYCDNRAFSYYTRAEALSLEEQIRQGMESLKVKKKAEKFILYFQAYTNTYAPVSVLRERYGMARKFPDIVGISIGTRPDCIDREKLSLIEEFSGQYEVWVEYGLQSIHDQTLRLINRGHTYKTFREAVDITRGYGKIKICAHVILGLPHETTEMICQTAAALARMKVEGVKIHPLHIIKGTKLEELFLKGDFDPLGFDEYVETAVSFLERLWPGTVIQRLTADCPRDILVGPDWIPNKKELLEKIEDKLSQENRFQGRLYGQ